MLPYYDVGRRNVLRNLLLLIPPFVLLILLYEYWIIYQNKRKSEPSAATEDSLDLDT